MDWTQITIAIFSLISTIIVTLIPIAATAFTDARTAKVVQQNTIIEHNQLIAEKTVLLIQATYGVLSNPEKFQLAVKAMEEELPTLTFDAIKKALNEAVGTMHLVWGDAWKELALPPAIPTVMPEVDSSDSLF